jgi:hypothetical protein
VYSRAQARSDRRSRALCAVVQVAKSVAIFINKILYPRLAGYSCYRSAQYLTRPHIHPPPTLTRSPNVCGYLRSLSGEGGGNLIPADV